MPGFRYFSRRLAIMLGAALAALVLHLLQPAPAPFGGSATAQPARTILSPTSAPLMRQWARTRL
jgi:hypothetical protein